MSLRDSQFGELKVPLTWTAAVALVVAGVIATALLFGDRRETFQAEAYGAARGAADGLLAPVGDALSAPGRWTGAGISAIRGYFFAVSENRRLKAELSDMRQWRDVALALKNENGRYRSLLGLKTDPPIPMVAARVVTDSRGPFANTRIANTGSEAGVTPGNPVMSEHGLVGRVIGVSTDASRVLMLTDVASRTPVMIDRTNARAILTGDGGPNPRLDYLRGQEPVREGDRVLTSGDGGIVPRGLPVGVAVKGLDGKWRVVLASERGPIDFVRILLFQDFTQVINRKALDELPVPPPTPGLPVEPTAPAAAGSATPPGAAAAVAGSRRRRGDAATGDAAVGRDHDRSGGHGAEAAGEARGPGRRNRRGHAEEACQPDNDGGGHRAEEAGDADDRGCAEEARRQADDGCVVVRRAQAAGPNRRGAAALSAARSLDPWRWLGVPLVQVLIATVLFGIPLRIWGLQLPEPLFAMPVVFAWAVIRPSVLAPFGILIMGLFLDLFWGGAMGLWALCLLIAYGILLAGRHMMAGQSKVMLWVWYGMVAGIAQLSGYLFIMLDTKSMPSLTAVGWQYLATVVLFPFAYRLIDMFDDADVRFR
ncbi:rod shape-determining protein MreC [Phenylobacterium sp. LjRoot219]